MQNFYNTIQQIVNRHCPLRKVRVRDDNPPWETNLTRKIRRARNKAYKNNKPSYKYLNKLLKKMISRNKKAQIDKRVNNLDNSNWWSSLSYITGAKKKFPPLGYLIDDKWNSPQELASKLN